jgi:protein-S-isoprenylcysteine O-methyltransferase Ste14
VNVFVVAYEEPALRRQFGAGYADYARSVGRWIPRLTPHAAARRQGDT